MGFGRIRARVDSLDSARGISGATRNFFSRGVHDPCNRGYRLTSSAMVDSCTVDCLRFRSLAHL